MAFSKLQLGSIVIPLVACPWVCTYPLPKLRCFVPYRSLCMQSRDLPREEALDSWYKESILKNLILVVIFSNKSTYVSRSIDMGR